MLTIDQVSEKQKITSFLKNKFQEQKINKAIIGLSGGIDSMVSFYLLKEVLSPENIIVAHLYYFDSQFSQLENVLIDSKIPKTNTYHLSIKESVDSIIKLEEIDGDKVRIGNIAARIRMIILFDLAKKNQALVCGTENKTENLLGYFTRFGDQASDIEPIAHLYKTQVRQLAKELKIPDQFIRNSPTAGLWSGQTDEGDFGFTYEEADQVLHQHLEKNKTLEELEKLGFKNTKKILDYYQNNLFKHKVPYELTNR